jgi:hypothetical protein
VSVEDSPLVTVEESFNCSGVNGSIKLYPGRLVVDSKELGGSKSHELPLNRITAVVVERKSVVPFAIITILAAAAAVLTRYNALWFLINLTRDNVVVVSSAALAAAIICAIPTVIRAFFVSVSITWDGEPPSFRVSFVPLRRGKRLAKQFQDLTMGS